MKKINLIKRLSRNSHEKQSPQRFGRYAAMLLLLVIWNAHAWAGVSGGDIYFDPAQSGWGTPTSVEYIVGHSSYSCWYAMANVTNTKLYYKSSNSWSDATYIAFTANYGWTSCEGNSYDSRKGYGSGYRTSTSNYGVNSGSVYLFYAASSSDDAAITTSSPAGYKSGGVTDLNSTQTVKFAIAENGGTPAELTSGTTPSQIRMRSYKFVSGTNGSVSSESPSDWSAGSSTYYKTFTAARTATTTVTVSNEVDGYTFLGWYTAANGGTQLSTNKAYTYYPSAATTVYARFSHETTHSVDITYVCASPSATVSSATSQAIGQVTASDITAPTVTGYTFVNWTLGNGVADQGSDLTANPISVKTLGSGTYTMQANYTEDLSSPYIVSGGDKIVTSGTTWRTTADANNKMNKKTGHSTESNAYFTVDVKAVNQGNANVNYQFKIYNPSTSTYYGLTGTGQYYLNRGESGTAKATSSPGINVELRADALGEYELKVNYSSTPTLTVTYPTAYAVNFGVRSGGSSASASYSSTAFSTGTKVQTGKSVTFTQTAATGYEFAGWYNASSGGTKVSSNEEYVATVGAATLNAYAAFTAKNYTGGTLNKNGGSEDGSYTVTYNATSITPSAPTKTGYHVEGYYTNAGCSIKVATPAGVLQSNIAGYTDATGHWNYDGTKELWAKWEANTHTVTLDDNGGSADGSATATYDATSLSSIGEPTKTGYHPEGYYTNAGCSVKVATPAGALQASTTYTDASSHWTYDADDATLVTKWEANTWYVKFNKNHNDATGTMSNESFTYDAAKKALTANAFERTGYHFDVWKTAPSGGTSYEDKEEVKNLTSEKNGIFNLYAQWEANKYTITLDNQCAYSDGTHTGGEATEFEVTYGTNYFTYYMTAEPSSYNYDFGGWYTAVGGGGDQIITDLGSLASGATAYTNASGKWNYDGNPTVYAKWSKSYTTGLSEGINANGGSGGAITLTYNSSATSGFTPSTRTGYILAGYYTAATDGDKVINADGTIVGGDIDGYVDDGKWVYCSSTTFKIYAHWTPITYTIAFDKNDDASYLNSDIGDDPDDIAATYAVSYTIPACPYTRTGYSFVGWSTAAHKAKGSVSSTPALDYDYRGDYPASNLSSTQGATVTLYPKWAGNFYTVSLNARGGSVYPTSIDVRYGEKYGTGYYGDELPEPLAPTGKEFIGWYTSPTGGTLVTKDTQMSTIGAHTLYARYSDIAMVYFKNTIGWEEVYVTYDAYWDNTNGTGNYGKIYHKMTQIYGTNIYFDRIPATILASWKGDIAFNSEELLTGDKHAPQDEGNYGNYNKGEVVFRHDFDSRATMFVPKDVNTNDEDGNYKKNSAQYISTGYKDGTTSDPEYTSGYWMKYGETYSGYLFSYQKALDSWSSEYGMNGAKAGDSVFVYSVKMDANTRYDLRIRKDCQTTNTKSRQFCYGTQITSAACTDLKLVCDPNNNSWMQTTAAGEYKFILTTKSDGHMYLTVEYPLAVNDYQVLYSWNDGSAKTYASEVIKAHPDTVDTISVFVHKLYTPVVSRSMKIQKCTDINGSGVPTWTDVTGGGIDLTDVTANGVYNFEITQPKSGDPTGAFAGKYEGDYYIRTTCSDGGWDQYKDREENIMTYSAYSMTQTLSAPYSHYYCHYIGSTSTDITFAVATKYSPNISGTMIGDAIIGNAATTLPANANVRFSWNEETNAMARAYIKDAQGPSNARFMVMHGADDDMIFNPNGSAIGASGSLAANELQFDDKGDWVYQVMLQAKPGAEVSIIANYNDADRYMVGGASSYTTILGGSGDEQYTIMAIYDFKTNRLMNAWTPGGTISDQLSDVDMLWIRYKQNAAQQITFSGSGSLENVKAVGAIQLDYDDLVGHVPSWTYETRPLLRYFISFPFDVNVSDIFGLHGAELGREFVIRKYDGAERAKNGFYKGDGDTYWIDLTLDSVMHANEGYSLVFDNEYLNGDLGTIWENKTGGSSVYLYFPAAAKIGAISDANKGTTLKQHLCEKTGTFDYKGSSVSHANSDSHWNLIGSPLFVNSYVYSSTGTNGQTGDKERTTLDSYYAYNVEFNYWEPEAYYSGGAYYACKAMHAMLVQFAGSVTWSKGAPASIAARRREDAAVSNQLITLNLLQNGEDGDHMYIKLDENGNSDFVLCEDLFKIDNTKIPNIFSYASGNPVAYNKVAIESQTINLGVDIRKNGTYTFEMPDNVAAQVILVDNFDGSRTNLNMENYEVDLSKGNYYDRFSVEINVNKMPTAIDGTEDGSGSLKDGKAHKFIENGVMYILENGRIYDAQGNRVK